MSFKPTILAQIIKLIDRLEFDRIEKNNSGNKYVKKITCQRLLTILFFTNLANIKSIASCSAEAEKSFTTFTWFYE